MRSLLKFIFIAVVGFFFSQCDSPSKTAESAPIHQISLLKYPDSSLLRYFKNSVLETAKSKDTNYINRGLANGVDAFVLMKVYPDLKPVDFWKVAAIGGAYSINNGKLMYTGDMASNSAVITQDGFQQLLLNCAKRMNINVTTKGSIDSLLGQL